MKATILNDANVRTTRKGHKRDIVIPRSVDTLRILIFFILHWDFFIHSGKFVCVCVCAKIFFPILHAGSKTQAHASL